MQQHESGQELTAVEVATWTAGWGEVQERTGRGDATGARSTQRRDAGHGAQTSPP
jgi:hypothetical protein